MSLLKSSLAIRQLEFVVFLGWPEKERAKKQSVLVDIDIQFSEVPKACLTDNIKDTLCYSTLITDLVNQTKNKSFRLIEHFAQHIFTIVKTITPHSTVQVRVSKQPNIEGYGMINVSFNYGDH